MEFEESSQQLADEPSSSSSSKQVPPLCKDTSFQSSRASRLSGRSSTTANGTPIPRIVFTTSSFYHHWCYILLAIPLLLILSLILYDLMVVYQNDGGKFQRKAQSWTLVWSFVFIVGIYLMVLPRQLDVRSNGTVGIKTFFLTYLFSDICRAYVTGWERNDFLRPRLKFATAFTPPHRVVIRRKNGQWDLIVAPTDPDGFVQAVEQVVSKIDELSAWTIVEQGDGQEEEEEAPQQQHPDMSLA